MFPDQTSSFCTPMIHDHIHVCRKFQCNYVNNRTCPSFKFPLPMSDGYSISTRVNETILDNGAIIKNGPLILNLLKRCSIITTLCTVFPSTISGRNETQVPNPISSARMQFRWLYQQNNNQFNPSNW